MYSEKRDSNLSRKPQAAKTAKVALILRALLKMPPLFKLQFRYAVLHPSQLYILFATSILISFTISCAFTLENVIKLNPQIHIKYYETCTSFVFQRNCFGHHCINMATPTWYHIIFTLTYKTELSLPLEDNLQPRKRQPWDIHRYLDDRFLGPKSRKVLSHPPVSTVVIE